MEAEQQAPMATRHNQQHAAAASQSAANRGTAVPAGKLKAAGAGRPGAGGNRRVRGCSGTSATSSTPTSSTGKKLSQQDPATGRDQSLNHQELRRAALKKAQADPSKVIDAKEAAGDFEYLVRQLSPDQFDKSRRMHPANND